MLFTEYISINIKHVFIGVYNTQSHPSKSRGPHNSGAGGVGPAHLHGGKGYLEKETEGVTEGCTPDNQSLPGREKGDWGGARSI